MANVPLDTKVQCPFFDRNISGESFRCESIISTARFDVIIFQNGEKKQQFMKKH